MSARGRLKNLAIDLAPAIGLCGLGLLELLGSSLSGPARAQHAFAVVVTSAAISARRKRPLGVALAVAATIVATSLGAEAPDEVAVLVACIIAVFSAAAYLPAGLAIGAAAANAVAMVVAVLTDESDSASNVAPTVVLFIAVPTALGIVYRRRRQALAVMAVRAAALEHERDERAREAVEEERRRIARELHDLVAHAVTVIAVQAEAGRRLLLTDGAAADRSFGSIADASRSALGELSRLLRVLGRDKQENGVGPTLDPPPELPRLDALVGSMRTAGLDIRMTTTGEPRQLDPGVSLCAFRVVQESLTNALKHGAAGPVEVNLGYDEQRLAIAVRTTTGAHRNASGTGAGLVGMWERVSLCGGALSLDVSDGFAVTAHLPLAAVVS